MAFLFWDKDVRPAGFDAGFRTGEQHAVLRLSACAGLQSLPCRGIGCLSSCQDGPVRKCQATLQGMGPLGLSEGFGFWGARGTGAAAWLGRLA